MEAGKEMQIGPGEERLWRETWDRDVMTVSGTAECLPWLEPSLYQGVQPLDMDE